MKWRILREIFLQHPILWSLALLATAIFVIAILAVIFNEIISKTLGG